MADSRPIRVGVLGTGAVAQLVHIPNCARRRDVDLVALADKDPRKAETLAQRFGVPRVVSTEDLLNSEEVDALIICTPNHLHESETVTALEAGRHVLVERPMALTPEGCTRVTEAARKADRQVMVGMNHRFRPDVAALRAFVQAGELGEVYSGRVAWMNRPVPLRRTTWRQRPEEAGGGALMDLGPQALDLLFWVLDGVRVTAVHAHLAAPDGEMDEAGSLLMRTESGASLTLEVSWSYFGPEDYHHARVLGRGGSGQLPPLEIFRQAGGRPMNITPAQPAPPRGGSRYLKAHRRQLDLFFRGIRGFAQVPLPEEQAHLMAVIQAAYESAREGREIEL